MPEDIDYKKELLDLLCIIHRDGGQYINKFGVRVAIEDARKTFYKLIDSTDASISKWIDDQFTKGSRPPFRE